MSRATRSGDGGTAAGQATGRERETFSFLFAQKHPQGEEPEQIQSAAELLKLHYA